MITSGDIPLKEINLSHNHISDKGALALAELIE